MAAYQTILKKAYITGSSGASLKPNPTTTMMILAWLSLQLRKLVRKPG